MLKVNKYKATEGLLKTEKAEKEKDERRIDK